MPLLRIYLGTDRISAGADDPPGLGSSKALTTWLNSRLGSYSLVVWLTAAVVVVVVEMVCDISSRFLEG